MRAMRLVLALVGITAVLALLASTAYLVVTGGDEGTLSSQNDDWRGLSEASDQIESMGYEVRPLFTTSSLLLEDDAPETTLFISLGPERPYTKTEIHALRKFYSGGGKLIVADDTTTSNRLSSRFDVSFQKGQLYDENYEKHPDFVKIDVNWEDFSGTVLMNRPGVLTHKNLRVIASSSPSAWLDKNGNGMMDPENISGGSSRWEPTPSTRTLTGTVTAMERSTTAASIPWISRLIPQRIRGSWGTSSGYSPFSCSYWLSCLLSFSLF